MDHSQTQVRLVAAGAGLGLVGTAWWLVGRVAHQWALVRAPGPASLEEAVVLVAALAALLLEGWFVLGTGAAVVAHLPGRCGRLGDRLAAGCAPRASRRIAAALLGAAAVGTVAPAALAAGGPSPGGTPSATTSIESSAPLPPPGFATTRSALRTTPPADEVAPPGWTPTRPRVRPQASPALLAATPPPSAGTDVVVHRGDTLWDIVRRHLGAQASDAEVAQAWPDWHATNRAVIGADPDLLVPGQVLRPPRPSHQGPASERAAGDRFGGHR
ncbi:LysM peptidoglycan-binding domain-containing protein [Nostocoides sp. HKS02]|uniref:LysM peptidoglycan-binding domain-containing protein n=1 Tax=Nostocoides sp. HKS02 TaxID=1813880 RepID=UPI0012B4889E|nr:hypothetical protein [Tetrasphaera sp. HKS02]QGN56717.1 hypothetical protein GKE56_01040 [Tetrasphaera sp. HKS02]